MTVQNKSQKAFTLIELLIVIAIIGIIAVAVLAALNPLEQINRSADTSAIADAQQLQSAMERFYTTNERYPWAANQTLAAQAIGYTAIADGVEANVDCGGADATNDGILESLTDCSAEIREALADRIDQAASDSTPFYVYRGGNAGDSAYVCFAPQSERYLAEAVERCTDTPSDYPGTACTVGSEHWCLP